MRVIILDTDRSFRALVRKLLARDLPRADVFEYDPDTRGRPGREFDWSVYDVLLLGDGVSGAANGLEWLRNRDAPNPLPPTIYLQEHGLALSPGAARGLGADHVVSKSELVAGRLAQCIESLLEGNGSITMPMERPVDPVSITGTEPMPQIEGYKLANLIGEGAMSRVYLGEREGDGMTIVLKVIAVDLVNNHAQVRRFVAEAELISELDSPHVVRIYEQGFTDDFGFIAMEFFPRGDLKQRIEHGITPADAVHCLANIAYGLEAIHRLTIVHRDLKPANVMFRHNDTLALADFGVSTRLASERGGDRPGSILGTPHYMSPEQGQGKPADVRNDLYSLGVMFYEMLTGTKPFHAASPAGIVSQHIHAEIPRLPRGLRRYQGLVDRLMAKNPEERYQTASELIAAL